MTPQQYEKLVAKIKANQIPDDLLDEAMKMVEEYKAQPKTRDAMTEAAYSMGAQITPEQGNEDRARGQVVPKRSPPVEAEPTDHGYLGIDPFARAVSKVKNTVAPVTAALLWADKSSTGGLGERAVEGATNLLHPLDYWQSLKENAARQAQQTPEEQFNEAYGAAPAPVLGPAADVRQSAAETEAEHPLATDVGVIGGFLLPGGAASKAGEVVPVLGQGLRGAARYGAKALTGAAKSAAGAAAIQGLNDNISDPEFAGRVGKNLAIAGGVGAVGGLAGEAASRAIRRLRLNNPLVPQAEQADMFETSVLHGMKPKAAEPLIEQADLGDLTKPALERAQIVEQGRVGPQKEAFYQTPEGLTEHPTDELLNVLKDTRAQLNRNGEVIPGREAAAKKLDNYIAKLTDWQAYAEPEVAAAEQAPAEANTFYRARPPNVAESSQAQTLYKARPPQEPEANTFYRARPPARPVEEADTLYRAKPPPRGPGWEVLQENGQNVGFQGIPTERQAVDYTLAKLGLKPEAIASMTDEDARALIDRVFARKPPPTTSQPPPVPGGEEATAAQGRAGTPKVRATSEATSLDIEGLSRQKPPAPEPDEATFYRARSPEPKPEEPTLYRARGPAPQETIAEGPATVARQPPNPPVETPAEPAAPRQPGGAKYNAQELDQLIEGLNQMHQEGAAQHQPLPNFRRIEEAARAVRDKFFGAGPNMPNEPGGWSAFKNEAADRAQALEAYYALKGKLGPEQLAALAARLGIGLPPSPGMLSGVQLRLDPALRFLAPRLGNAGAVAPSITQLQRPLDDSDIIFGR